MATTKFEDFIQDYERRRVFEQESLAFEATEMICTLLKQQGVSKAELAKRIGKSKAYITQVLSGSRNMTLHTFADFSFALGFKVDLKHVPAGSSHDTVVCRWEKPFRDVFKVRNICDARGWKNLSEARASASLQTPEDGSPDSAHAA